MKKIITVLGLFLSFSAFAFAAGLHTNFGEVKVENLKIGHVYNLRELVNLPLRIKYDGPPMDVYVTVEIPGESMLKEGYEPLPDISWVNIAQDRFTMSDGEEARTDVIVSIPDDEKYYGKKFQVQIGIYTEPIVDEEKGGIVLAASVGGRLLMHISEHPMAEEEKEKFVEKKVKGNLGFQLFPTKIFLKDVPLGEKVSLKQLGKSLKLLNPTDEDVSLELVSLNLEKEKVYMPQGYEKTQNSEFFQIEKKNWELKGNAIENVEAYLSFPDDEKFSGKKYVFVVEAKTKGNYVSMSVWTHIYVATEENGKQR